MKRSSIIKKLFIRLGSLVLLMMIFQIAMMSGGAPKAYAYDPCGIIPGVIGDSSAKSAYGGLVINLVGERYNGTTFEALGNIGMVFTGENNMPPGYWGAELALYKRNERDPHQSVGVIPQTGGHHGYNCGNTVDGAGVVLGTGSDHEEWLIDCNASVRNGDPGGAWYTGYGVPDGVRGGGWWDNKMIKAANGTTTIFELRYHEPPPPGDGWAVYEASWGPDTCLISGWAVDTGVPTNQINVHIYMDGPAGGGGVGVANIVASSPWGGVRAAMQAAYGVDVGPDGFPGDPPGSGHGFHFPVPAGYKDGNNHTAYVYGIKQSGGSNWELHGSPVSFRCSALPTVYRPWFQVKNGSVMAEGSIKNQSEGAPGARPVIGTSLPTDATNVIINAFYHATGSVNINNAQPKTGLCSDNFYGLSTTQQFTVGNSRQCQVGHYMYRMWDNIKAAPGTSDKELKDGDGFRVKSINSTYVFDNLLSGKNNETADRTIFNTSFWQAALSPSVRTAFESWPRKADGSGTNSNGVDDCNKSTLDQPANIKNNDLKQIYNDDTSGNYIKHKTIWVCPLNQFVIGGNGPITITKGGRTGIFVADGNLSYDYKKDVDPDVPRPKNPVGKRDLYIKNNIRTYYPSGAGQDIRTYPNLSLIVAGDIYIDPAVTDIDASLYAAGRIYTCSIYPAPVSPLGPLPSYWANPTLFYRFNGPACNKQLTIRGLVGSRAGIVFGRTYFNPSPTNTNGAAEIISVPPLTLAYPPVGWGKWDASEDNGTTFSGINAFSSQPRFK